MSKRLEMLEKMTSAGSRDPFAWYALAMEYAALTRIDDAIRTFEALRTIDDNYVPMYLMSGTTLIKAGRTEEARSWLTCGIEKARAKGDTHALSELEHLLSETL